MALLPNALINFLPRLWTFVTKITRPCVQQATDEKDNSTSDPACVAYCKAAGGKDPICDEVNACSFLLQMNGTEELIYVSYEKRDPNTTAESVTYKICPNKLIIYSP
ncbi:hypothetical protein WDU94_006765 [Cyamophila willieti]